MVYDLVISREAAMQGLRLVAAELVQGRRVAALDAANCFNPFLLTRVIHRLRLDRRLLSRVVVSRAFTCHQLEALALGRLPAVDRVFVIDPGALLYDGEVRPDEAARSAARIARALARIPGVVVTMGEPPGAYAAVFEIFRAGARILFGDDDGKNRSDVQPAPAFGAGRAAQIPPRLEAGRPGDLR